MPTIARFYGIIIRMYFLPREHNPPHIHVIYGEETFSISLADMEIIDGELNPTSRVLSMVKEWISLHKQELLNMWNTQDIAEIEPLR